MDYNLNRYNATKQYNINDIATDENNISYIAIQSNSGINLSNTAYWRQLDSKIKYFETAKVLGKVVPQNKGSFSKLTNYKISDIVSYNENEYIAIKDINSSSNTPSSSPSNWQILTSTVGTATINNNILDINGGGE